MALLAPIRNYIGTLVHPSARQDALSAARHRAFIAPRLLGSIVALASFPVYLIVRGAPSATELVVFAWLIAPILTAYFLSRTVVPTSSCTRGAAIFTTRRTVDPTATRRQASSSAAV